MARMTTAHVAQHFSAVIDRVAAGESTETVRNGALVAELRPSGARLTISEARWREMVASAPPSDERFAEDVEEARRWIGPFERPVAVLIASQRWWAHPGLEVRVAPADRPSRMLAAHLFAVGRAIIEG